MKKLLCLILVIISCSACGKKDITECTYTGEVQEGMKASYYYKMTSCNGYVELLESEEVITLATNNEAISFKDIMAKAYENYNGLKYYDFDISIDGNIVTRKSKINYAKIDTKKLVEVDELNSALVKDGKVKLEDVLSIYETIGTTCKTN